MLTPVGTNRQGFVLREWEEKSAKLSQIRRLQRARAYVAATFDCRAGIQLRQPTRSSGLGTAPKMRLTWL